MSCSNFVAISSLVLELLKKCRVRQRVGHAVYNLGIRFSDRSEVDDGRHTQPGRQRAGSLFPLIWFCKPCLSDSLSLKLNFIPTLRTVCTIFIYINYAYYSNLNFGTLFHTYNKYVRYFLCSLLLLLVFMQLQRGSTLPSSNVS